MGDKCKVPTDPEAKKWFDEVQRQARQIDHLLQLHELKERTIEKLSKRLEHSLQMLKAVQEMYEQQQRVIGAQQKVIEEFNAEGDEDEDEAEAESEPAVVTAPRQVQQARPTTPAQNGMQPVPRSPANQVERTISPKSQAAAVEQRVQQLLRQAEGQDDDDDDLDGQESPEQQIQKMLSLVSEVEKMRKMLIEAKAEQEALEGGGNVQGEEQRRPAPMTQIDDDDLDLDDENLTAEQQQGELAKLLQNLKMVEDEKKRTQKELMAAQQEQESMVRKLSEMKAMMTALDKEVKGK